MNSQKKSELRHIVRERRKTLSNDALSASWIHILQSPEFQNLTHVASYISYGTEPRTDDLNLELMHRGVQVIVPKLLPDKDLAWINLQDGGEFTSLERVNVVIIPALGIDQKGYRLGQGGGSYDRALPRFSAWKIALLHEGEIHQTLAHDEWDIKVDAAADSKRIVRF